jgi:hypothetical protein
MPKSKFQGDIPEHLLSSEARARRARKEQERQEVIPLLRRLQHMANNAIDDYRYSRKPVDEIRVQATAVVTELARLFRIAPANSERADLASQIPAIVNPLFKAKALDVQHLREQLMGLKLLADQGSVTGGKPMFERKFDASMRKYAKSYGIAQEDSDMLRSLMLEAGLTSLADVPMGDLRHSVIGAALTQNPARISEVKNLDAFLDVALRFQIDVELPEDLSEARVAEHKASVLRQSMRATASSAADPLAGVAESPAPRRLARHP